MIDNQSPISSSECFEKLKDIYNMSFNKNSFRLFYNLFSTMLNQYGYKTSSNCVLDIGKKFEKNIGRIVKPGGGGSKGAAFERQICKILSLWISNNEHEDVFWRSPLSGGRFTVSSKKSNSNIKHSGDVSITDTKGQKLIDKFNIELKFYKSLNIEGLIFNTKSGIRSFWDQTLRDSRLSKKLPMLIAKQNTKNPLLILNSDGVKFFKRKKCNIGVISVINDIDMHISDFYSELKNIDPKIFK